MLPLALVSAGAVAVLTTVVSAAAVVAITCWLVAPVARRRTPVHGTAPRWLWIRPRAVAVGAGTVAFAVVVPFVLSVVRHFAHGPGNHHSQGLIGLVGESAYGLVMLALLALLPMRRAAPVDGRDESVVEAGARDETGFRSAGLSAARSSGPSRPGGWSPR